MMVLRKDGQPLPLDLDNRLDAAVPRRSLNRAGRVELRKAPTRTGQWMGRACEFLVALAAAPSASRLPPASRSRPATIRAAHARRRRPHPGEAARPPRPLQRHPHGPPDPSPELRDPEAVVVSPPPRHAAARQHPGAATRPSTAPQPPTWRLRGRAASAGTACPPGAEPVPAADRPPRWPSRTRPTATAASALVRPS
ncbi:hypothetical protein FH608_050580 [Nonomuraea phyllanthi]|uniref:Uncharacterized protein n=1 Tax=Nonomuraea phyllanthi TaxID=2219224 RepID=A0A5C4UT02_9ACTN|nr:hypothetical protein FH608_050580 [Nonomuraea phyllanthi]QFY10190.1 hypothetical protein GBF35_29345 [Nonomuraea phyllanthi]